MNGCETQAYKSPKRKLLRFFERSRDQWKIKCKAAKATVKKLSHRIRYLEDSKTAWKTKAINLEEQLAELNNYRLKPVDSICRLKVERSGD